MKVVVFSAHPDDEIIGAGGTLLKHKEADDEMHWIIITNVLESSGFSKDRVESRQKEIAEVAEKIGFQSVSKFDYATMSLTDESLITMIPKISELFQNIKPEIIYTLNRSDAHSDHRILFQAVMACTKSFRHPYIKKVLMYECISETEFAPALAENIFIPNYYVDISNHINKKIEILNIYESEMGDHPFPRSNRNILALATYRGAVAGVNYAEAFQLIKFIDK
jgi:N-acetylglucosamine malate deacetylase 1